jgi:hypothetical protein
MIKCGECGYENMDGLDYCDGCGAKLEAAAPAGGGPLPALSAPSAGPAAAAEAAAAPAESATAAAEAAPAESATAAAEAAPAPPAPAPSSEAPTGEIKASEAASDAPAQPAAAAAAPFKAKLSVLRGGRKGQEFELESGKNFVGRWDPDTGSFPEVDLDADDPEAKISRRHALLIIEGGKITIEDIGSLNGTYVNRQPRLAPGTPVELKNGDEIIIGKTFLKLVVDPIS